MAPTRWRTKNRGNFRKLQYRLASNSVSAAGEIEPRNSRNPPHQILHGGQDAVGQILPEGHAPFNASPPRMREPMTTSYTPEEIMPAMAETRRGSY